MPRFHRPERRNRNIGTPKQGHGKNNRMVIPYPGHQNLEFYERLGRYTKVRRSILGKQFLFVVEETREDCVHACTVDDLAKMLELMDLTEIGDLSWFVLRQPKRKEVTLSSVWGRLIYSYEFEYDYAPAVIIEAIDLSGRLRWHRKLCIERQAELKRLQDAGHNFQETRRHYEAPFELAHAE